MDRDVLYDNIGFDSEEEEDFDFDDTEDNKI